MSNDKLEGKWKQVKGSLKQEWGKLTDNDIKQIEGRSDRLIGKLEERYGMAKDKAAEALNNFMAKFEHNGETAEQTG